LVSLLPKPEKFIGILFFTYNHQNKLNKKVMKKAVVIFGVFFLALVNFAFAQEPGIVTSDKAGWHKIGETKADFKAENESISVMGADRFKSIKLKVTEAPISIKSVQVFYESGEVEDLEVAKDLNPGEETKVFDLKDGASKEIKKVVFTYNTVSGSTNAADVKAHVELYGLK
jgi:uncharacterized membrane protein YqhA